MPLGLARVERQVFGAGGEYADVDRIYFTDLLRTYNMNCREEAFAAGRNTFREMVAALMPRLASFTDRFDLAVMANATPDAEPGWPMCYFNHHVADPGLSFAISDQGVVAPFTALRVIADLAFTDQARRAILLIMDQSALVHSGPVPERLRARRDAVVALVFDTAGGLGSLSMRHSIDVAPGEVAAYLNEEARQATAVGTASTALYGQGLRPLRPDLRADELRFAAPGLPCTGAWSMLAESLPSWSVTGRRVLIADYDEDLRRLAFCTINVTAGGVEVVA
jgi:hypothetical protein